MAEPDPGPETDVLRVLKGRPGLGFLVLCSLLALVFAWALLAWHWQITNGLGVTGLNAPVFWGVYLINFVFFIGISHAGTLLSAILRILDAEWRRPFTRIAEVITIASLPFAATCVIIDLGRPDRLLSVVLYPHLTSPILWDVFCISTYLALSCLYFFIALVPDLALCRDRLTDTSPLRRLLYRLLALGWRGAEAERRLHHRLMTGLSIALLAVVVSVHTNVAFVFGMTTKAGWHTAIIGPYFVVGAAFQGLGALAFISVLLRRFYGLRRWMPDELYNYLGKFLLALLCFWFYLTFTEYLTNFYGGLEAHLRVFWANVAGANALAFWSMALLCVGIPFPLLAIPRWRRPVTVAIAGLLINIGMWLERYTILVPAGSMPYLTWGVGTYSPTWVEWSITAGWVAGFILLLALFFRVFPCLTLWEIREGLKGVAAQEAAPLSLSKPRPRWGIL